MWIATYFGHAVVVLSNVYVLANERKTFVTNNKRVFVKLQYSYIIVT